MLITIQEHISRCLSIKIFDFLGYNKNISEDFKVLISGFNKSNLNSEMKLKMVENMLLTKDLTSEQKDLLNQLLNTV